MGKFNVNGIEWKLKTSKLKRQLSKLEEIQYDINNEIITYIPHWFENITIYPVNWWSYRLLRHFVILFSFTFIVTTDIQNDCNLVSIHLKYLSTLTTG